MKNNTLFLLPGLMCDETAWEHQLANLSDMADISVPDFRGFDSLTAMAESVLETAPETFNVAGHSMGGRVALEIINLAPDRVDKLGLLDTGAHPLADGEREKRESFIDIAQTGGMDAVADAWILPMVHPDRKDDRELLDSIRAMIKRTSVEDLVRQVHALVNRPDARDYLKYIQCDTLLLVGSDDNWSPVDQHREMLENIAGSRLVIIEDAGHMATMEKPAEVTEALREWLIK